jgi:predicted O-linked N-acetylglucosamine transferase (SPINDLY family)
LNQDSPQPARTIDELNGLILANDYVRAEAVANALLRENPEHVDALVLHAFIMLQQGRAEAAVESAKSAARLQPSGPLMVNLARAQLHAGDKEGALATLDAALAKWPDLAQAWVCALEVHINAGHYLAAANRGVEGRRHCPNALDLAMVTAYALHDATRSPEAIEICKSMLARFPTDPWIVDTIASFSNYVADLPPAEVFERHRRYGRLLARYRPAPPRQYKTPPREGRRLRVGFISPDFRAHSVSFFLQAIFRNYRREKFEFFAYFTKRVGDEVTEILRSQVDHWRSMIRPKPEELAKVVGDDTLDLLIDLAGYTEGNCLEGLHTRPAPRQATYLGYPNTTGLAAVDFRIVDSITDPPGSEAFNTERLVRLDPCFICFEPPKSAPGCGPPSRADEPITFASFNALKKINDPLIGLWSRVLNAVPGSRLLIKCKGLGEAAMCDDLRRRFGSHGIDPGRLELVSQILDPGGHLAVYRRVHIALDTFPYHGTTTTCDAMWMGVPVVTLEGAVHASRVGLTLLSCVGLPELIAKTPEQYVQIASGLAADRDRLNGLRAGLRERMASSPLCDGPAFCRRFEAALDAMIAG